MNWKMERLMSSNNSMKKRYQNLWQKLLIFIYLITHLILSITPLGTPMDTAADNELCSETFFSALHSMTEFTVPTLK